MHPSTIARLAAAVAATVITGCAVAQAAPAREAHGMLATPTGQTLYTFDKDAKGAGTSACNGPCATLWPAFTAAAGATASGDWSLVKREDGAMQWAYKGAPLYVYSKDAKPGDMAGDNFKDIWHVAKP